MGLVVLAGCGGGGSSMAASNGAADGAGNGASEGGAAGAAAAGVTGNVTTVAACSAKPTTSGSGYGRVETPVAWNYQVTEPSTSACAGGGTVYEVGPGKKYVNPRDVPWTSLKPCDQVLIYYRAQPYTDVLYIGARGEANQYITIKGVRGPNGERPIFDGNGAVMPTNVGVNPYVDVAGMIIVAKPNLPDRVYRNKPGYLLITGLNIRNTRAPANVTNLKGVTASWQDFAAGLYISPAEHVAIVDNEFGDNSLGLFVNSQDDEASQSRDLLVRNNYFHGNGMVGKASMHNAYTEAIGTIYEGNYFGPPVKGTQGDNIKERSAGLVFRYNYVEDGVNLLALRDPQSNAEFEGKALDCLGERLASSLFVYANTFVTRTITVWDNLPFITSNGDGIYGDGRMIRDGAMYFYSNQVVSYLDYKQNAWDGVTLFNLINTRSPTTIVARNNLFYAASATPTGTPAPFGLFYWAGLADFQSNWINRFVPVLATSPDGGLAVGPKFNGDGLGGLSPSTGNPGFTDANAGNFTPGPNSPFKGLTAPVPDAALRRGLAPVGNPVSAPFGPR